MGRYVSSHFLAFIVELDVIELKHISIESGSLGRYNKTNLHLAIESSCIAIQAICKVRTISSLDANETFVGCQFDAWLTIGEVVEWSSKHGWPVLHSIEYLYQTTAKLIAQHVFRLTILIDKDIHSVFLGNVFGGIVEGGLFIATIRSCRTENILAGKRQIAYQAWCGNHFNISGTLRIALDRPCYIHVLVVLQLELVYTSRYIAAWCGIDRTMVRSCIGSHAYKGVVDRGASNCQSDSFEVNLCCRKGCRSFHNDFTVLGILNQSKTQEFIRDVILAYFVILFVEKCEFNARAYRKIGEIKSIKLESHFCSLRECFLAITGFGNNSNRSWYWNYCSYNSSIAIVKFLINHIITWHLTWCVSWLFALRIQSKRLSTLLFSVFRNTILLVVGNSILMSLAYKCILDIYSREHIGIYPTLNELDFIEITGSCSHVQFVDLVRTRECQ